MVSVGLVLLRVFLRRGIESPEQLEEIGINVYASVPVSENFAKKQCDYKVEEKKEDEQGFLALRILRILLLKQFVAYVQVCILQ
jgi:tyrosine-protein kinase Etk/Wzc